MCPQNSRTQSDDADVEQVQLFDELIDGISGLLPWDEERNDGEAGDQVKRESLVLRYPERSKSA